MKEINLFAESDRLKQLEQLDDTLIRLDRSVAWEQFRSTIRGSIRKEDRGQGGRPSYDEIQMFKILVLQRLYNLSDDQTEYQIKDRLSFQRFLGLILSSRVPDAKMIWLYHEQLVKAKRMDFLFGLLRTSWKKRHHASRQHHRCEICTLNVS